MFCVCRLLGRCIPPNLPLKGKTGGKFLSVGLALSFGFFSSSIVPRSAQAGGQNPGTPASAPNSPAVRMAMKNVDFHLTDRIIVHIATLNGRLTSDHGGIPVFDDRKSFDLDVDSATIVVGTTALSNDLNDYVFAKPDAPLKKLVLTTKGNQLVLKGILASKGGISFESDGTVEATPDGQIRIHTLKVKALHLPVKGLMDLLGLDTAKLIDTKKINGITADKDDLVLDPQQLLPPPRMRGHLSSVRIENGGISLVFATKGQKIEPMVFASRCGGSNFQSFKGGTVRFGKLTMIDSDLELTDSSPADPFDFSIDHYQDQLVAGYSKMTRQGGLCVHVVDFNKLKHASRH